jgi:hypothetical protein
MLKSESLRRQWTYWLIEKQKYSILCGLFRGVAQLVARTAGGREVAGSSPVTPTSNYFGFRSGLRVIVFLGYGV